MLRFRRGSGYHVKRSYLNECSGWRQSVWQSLGNPCRMRAATRLPRLFVRSPPKAGGIWTTLAVYWCVFRGVSDVVAPNRLATPGESLSNATNHPSAPPVCPLPTVSGLPSRFIGTYNWGLIAGLKAAVKTIYVFRMKDTFSIIKVFI